MDWGETMRNKGVQFRFFIGLIVVAVIPLLFFGMYGYQSSAGFAERVEMEKINSYHKEIGNDINAYFRTSVSDVQYIKELLELGSALHPQHESDAFFDYAAMSFSTFIKTHKNYDHVRIMDKNGMEIVRINNVAGNPVQIPADRLQDKSDRDYYKASMDLLNGEIYISPIDLNIENDTYEKPYKAVVRYVTPINVKVNDHSERYFLVANLNVSYLLSELRGDILTSAFKETYIIDGDGYYLLNEESEKEWGFAEAGDEQESWYKDVKNSEKWLSMELGTQVVTSAADGSANDGSFFINWHPVRIECVDDTRWTIITVIPDEKYLLPVFVYMRSYIGLVATTLVLLFILSTTIASRLSKPIRDISKAVSEIGKGNFQTPLDVRGGAEIDILAYEIKKMSFELENSYKDMEQRVEERTEELQRAHDRMKEMANTDPLTGIFNRHYFNNYIEDLKKDKRVSALALIMLDVDRFKYINDHYGHNVGDEVLVEVAKMLEENARGSDFVVRYGGDEFLIVLMDSDEKAIEAYVDRIKTSLDTWNKTTDILDHEMEFSIGYDVYTGSKHIIEVINSADDRMYAEKMARRKERGQVGRV